MFIEDNMSSGDILVQLGSLQREKESNINIFISLTTNIHKNLKYWRALSNIKS